MLCCTSVFKVCTFRLQNKGRVYDILALFSGIPSTKIFKLCGKPYDYTDFRKFRQKWRKVKWPAVARNQIQDTWLVQLVLCH